MTPYQNRHSANTKRLAEDMKIRHFADATIDAYTYHIGRFGDFLDGTSLQDATPEHVRSFQLHLIEERKVGWSSFNQAVCGLRFLYRTTYPKPWPVAMIPFGKRPKRLPTVLGIDEVDGLLQCVPSLKIRTCLTTLYACGLRYSEGANLTIPDIDSTRMQLRIGSGKGDKTRYVPISPRLLQELRQYWKVEQPPNFLFPGKTPDCGISDTSLRKAMKLAGKEAGINKSVSPHTLRHSYATGLLESGVDLLTISRLLGHKSFATTMIYLHVRRTHLGSAPSPIDLLPVRQLPGWKQDEYASLPESMSDEEADEKKPKNRN
ncbi:site-specific integrase [Novipirellula caenicola]|uniref:Tyrosine recombinase XerD n=1 Tax=Novipirellula caenicola TaxID=1536901 RepID=A0ABP9W1E1_9BACT